MPDVSRWCARWWKRTTSLWSRPPGYPTTCFASKSRRPASVPCSAALAEMSSTPASTSISFSICRSAAEGENTQLAHEVDRWVHITIIHLPQEHPAVVEDIIHAHGGSAAARPLSFRRQPHAALLRGDRPCVLRSHALCAGVDHPFELSEEPDLRCVRDCSDRFPFAVGRSRGWF